MTKQDMIDQLVEAIDRAFAEYLLTRDFYSATALIIARELLTQDPPDLPEVEEQFGNWRPDFDRSEVIDLIAKVVH